jgi:polyisoprenoid-binding protein YceI
LKLIAGGLAGLAVLAVAGFAAWFLFLRDDGPEEVSTAGALEALEDRTPTTAATATSGGGGTGIDGNWTVDTSLGSFVGYRVQEELVGIGGATAVGRTAKVSGSFTIANNKASGGTITADMTALRSQESLRDGQLRNQGIEYGKFPTSEFKLEATDVPSDVAAGKTASVTLKGSLTLHGVTKQIEMPAEVTFKDGVVVVVGQVDIKFADYNISKPQSVRVASVEDHGVMEVQLFFKRG